MNNSYKPLSVTLEKFHTMPEAYKNHCVRIMSMTAFSFRTHNDGIPIANRIEPGKRPRSSMAPTIMMKVEHF